MERKRSGLGIAAGILFSILFLYSVWSDITVVLNRPSGYWNIDVMFWWIRQATEVCASVFMIISLFLERRSWLLLVSHIINSVLYCLDIVPRTLRDNSFENLYSVTNLMLFVSMILRTVMVVCLCIPSLQKKAGWTGKIWFIPPVLTGIAVIVSNAYYHMNEYLENFAYHPLWMTFQLLLIVINIVSVFLFCLWLTEPVCIKKEKLQLTEQ